MLMLFLLLISSASGFSGRSTSSRRILKPMGLCLASERSPSLDPSYQRKDVLASLVAVTTAAATTAFFSRMPLVPNPPSARATAATGGTTVITQLSSVEEALALIETSCDRRFLHAVVASGYRLMYRGITPKEASSGPCIRTEPSDLLVPSTYGSQAAADFFAALEDRMRAQPVKPSNGHVAVTSADAAKVWGGDAASIWPLGGDVHFAWPEEGDTFWPTASQDRNAKEPNVIVDGVDCGLMSLEDALESNQKEIMFSAERFLAIPVSLETKLLEGLQSAFII
jgi:hypothetical protein